MVSFDPISYARLLKMDEITLTSYFYRTKEVLEQKLVPHEITNRRGTSYFFSGKYTTNVEIMD